MTFDDDAVDVISIVRPVASKRSDRACHLIKRRPDLRTIIDIIRRQLRRNDLPGASVDAALSR